MSDTWLKQIHSYESKTLCFNQRMLANSNVPLVLATLTTTYYLFGERLARHERSEVGGANDGPSRRPGAGV